MIGSLLQVLSGLSAIAAAGLLAYRVWTLPAPVVTPPAVYAPVAEVVKPGHVSVTESAANGFILVIESQPDSATVLVNDVASGETPASINYDCKPGETYRLTLQHAGYETLRHELQCKKDVMLIVKARLDRRR